MKSMGKICCVLVVVLLAALAVFPGVAKSEMYVEAYLGGTQAANARSALKMDSLDMGLPGRFDPAFLGGLKIGTWFVREGFLGYRYPDWMKHFGFYLDFNYHRLNMRPQNAAFFDGVTTQTYTFVSNGSVATLAFMFAARYGFYPDSAAPLGRFQPYLGLGPALLFASQRTKISNATFA